MRLPGGDRAVIPQAKIAGYLLSDTHPVGRFKARVLRAGGFTVGAPESLVSELRRVAAEGEVEGTEDNPFGRKYLVRGTLVGPTGSVDVVSVWFVGTGTDLPVLVTVLPR